MVNPNMPNRPGLYEAAQRGMSSKLTPPQAPSQGMSVPGPSSVRRLDAPAAPQAFAPRGNAPKGSKQLRNEQKAAKLTKGGTVTPTGKDLKKYNKAVGNNVNIVNKRAGQLGYGNNAYSQASGLSPRQFTPAKLAVKAGLQRLTALRRLGGHR